MTQQVAKVVRSELSESQPYEQDKRQLATMRAGHKNTSTLSIAFIRFVFFVPFVV